MVYVFLADGFEEMEAIVPIDLMRRAGIAVKTVGVGSSTPTGSHGVTVMADISEDVFLPDKITKAIVLPGGAGVANLERSDTVKRAVRLASEKDITLAAICGAPAILAEAGLLRGKRATIFPSLAKKLGASYVAEPVVYDEPFLTAKSAAYAVDFSLKLIEIVKSKKAANEVAAAIYYQR